MNFLGHSMFPVENRDERIIFGNVCGDFFKGSVDQLNLDAKIKEGISLHRYLDSATDSNRYFLKNKRLLTKYRLYSGVILDIFNDHFLAKNFSKFSDISLKEHSAEIYRIIGHNEKFLSSRGQRVFMWMEREDWLSNYNKIEFLEDVLYGISSRFKRENNLYESVKELKFHYSELEENFYKFWEDISIIVNAYQFKTIN